MRANQTVIELFVGRATHQRQRGRGKMIEATFEKRGIKGVAQRSAIAIAGLARGFEWGRQSNQTARFELAQQIAARDLPAKAGPSV